MNAELTGAVADDPGTKVILALGKNWDHKGIEARRKDAMSAKPLFDPSAKYVTLSAESKMTAHAAARLFLEEMARNPESDAVIVCAGGPTGKAEGWPSEGGAIRDYIVQQYPFDGPKRPRIELADRERTGEELPGIDPNRVKVEDESPDTWDNARRVKEVLATFHNVCLTICTVGFHAPRTTTIFERSGYENFEVLHSEEIMRGRSPRHSKLVDEFQQSWRWWLEEKRELLFRLILTVDRKGRIPQFTAKLARMRKSKEEPGHGK